MAYSGTISQTVFNTRKVIDSAVRRCKIPAEQITAEHIETANNELYLFLSSLANMNAPLWCTQKQIYPLYDGVADVETLTGTVDVLNSTLRQLFFPTGNSVFLPGSRTWTFDTPTAVGTVGVLWTVPAVPLVFERSDDGIVWVPAGAVNPVAVAGEKTWFDLEQVVATLKFRITGVLGASGTYLGNTPSEIPLSRLNRDDYVNLPNKVFPSERPLQYWLDRQVRTPVMRLWPVPNAQAANHQLVVWAHRHIMDVGSMTQEIEVPQRWYDAVVAGLAARMGAEIPEVPAQMIPILDQKATQSLMIAQQEERDNSTKRIAPDFSAYTA